MKELEHELHEHGKKSSIKHGRIDVAHARKKKRLDEELEAAIETIEAKRHEVLAVDDRLAELLDLRQDKEDEMKVRQHEAPVLGAATVGACLPARRVCLTVCCWPVRVWAGAGAQAGGGAGGAAEEAAAHPERGGRHDHRPPGQGGAACQAAAACPARAHGPLRHDQQRSEHDQEPHHHVRGSQELGVQLAWRHGDVTAMGQEPRQCQHASVRHGCQQQRQHDQGPREHEGWRRAGGEKRRQAVGRLMRRADRWLPCVVGFECAVPRHRQLCGYMPVYHSLYRRRGLHDYQ